MLINGRGSICWYSACSVTNIAVTTKRQQQQQIGCITRRVLWVDRLSLLFNALPHASAACPLHRFYSMSSVCDAKSGYLQWVKVSRTRGREEVEQLSCCIYVWHELVWLNQQQIPQSGRFCMRFAKLGCKSGCQRRSRSRTAVVLCCAMRC